LRHLALTLAVTLTNALLSSLFKCALFRWRSFKVIRVVVIVQIELFVEGPVNKLNKKNLTFAVLISLFPLLVHIAGVDAPLFQQRSRLYKFLLVNTLVLAIVNFVESNEEFVVLTQKFEKIPELFAFGYVVVTVLCFCL